MTPEEFYELWPFPINTKAVAFKFAKAYAEHESKAILNAIAEADNTYSQLFGEKKIEALQQKVEEYDNIIIELIAVDNTKEDKAKAIRDFHKLRALNQ